MAIRSAVPSRPAATAPNSDSGFSLVELLLAALLLFLLASGTAGVLGPRISSGRAQPEAVDMIQRARAALDVVSADLVMAGAGVDDGPVSGGLSCCLPPVVPRRVGLQSADAPDVARADAISVVFVSANSSSSTLFGPLAGSSPVMVLDNTPSCPLGRPLCGLAQDDTIVVFDRLGTYGFFLIDGPPAVNTATLALRQGGLAPTFAAAAAVARAETHTYYFDQAQQQIRHYDGRLSDVPAVDNVVAAAFEYWGDPRPPTAPRPPPGTANCLYDALGQSLSVTGVMPSGGESLVPLSLAILRDGPWCGAGANRFDVDLLRIRRVRLSVRVQAASGALRASGAAYLVPGTSSSALRALPDFLLSIDITPRNLDPGR